MELKAKTSSLIGIIISAVLLVAMAISIIVKFLTDATFTITLAEVGAMVFACCSPAIPFSPTFISMWIDKFIELKNGKKEK